MTERRERFPRDYKEKSDEGDLETWEVTAHRKVEYYAANILWRDEPCVGN